MFYCEILSGLWIGDVDMMYNREFLQDNDISIIVNCTIEYQFPEIDIIKNRIPLSQQMNESDIYLLQKNIQKIISYLDKGLNMNHILVCCYDGKVISPLLVACYIKYKDPKLTTQSIMDAMKTKHADIIFPHSLDMF
tara:strand:- start:551 stop:961 length:411 start_codon:yes stop_codon:yes gene_type:complete